MKIMELIDKDENVKTGELRLKLLDTTFTSLGKGLGSVPGDLWRGWTAGDIFSFQGMQNLNSELNGSSVDTRYRNFVNSYNAWINSIRGTISGVLTHEPPTSYLGSDWTSHMDEGFPVNLNQLLSPISLAAKELYHLTEDTREVSFDNHFNINREIMQDWSKNRNYGDTVHSYRGWQVEFRTGLGNPLWGDPSCDFPGIIASYLPGSPRDKRIMVITGELQNVPVGTIVTAQAEIKSILHGGGTISTIWYHTFQKVSLGNVSQNTGYWAHVRSWDVGSSSVLHSNTQQGTPAVRQNKGTGSGHFAHPGGNNLTFPWLQSRVLR